MHPLRSALPPALLLCAALAPAARAQVPGVNLQLAPKIGAYVPLSDPPELRTQAGTFQTELESGLAIGLIAEVDLPLFPINLRAGLDYATDAEIEVGEDGFDRVDATILALSGDLVYRPLPRIVVAQPFLVAGVGAKIYDFDTEETQSQAVRDVFADDRRDFTVHLGAGLDVRAGPIALFAEAGDYISWLRLQEGGERKTQNDAFAMVGFRVGLF